MAGKFSAANSNAGDGRAAAADFARENLGRRHTSHCKEKIVFPVLIF